MSDGNTSALATIVSDSPVFPYPCSSPPDPSIASDFFQSVPSSLHLSMQRTAMMYDIAVLVSILVQNRGVPCCFAGLSFRLPRFSSE